jgi:hypothetical protein
MSTGEPSAAVQNSGFFYLVVVFQWDSNSTPLFSAKKACAEHLWPERLLCALHMLFIV